MYKPTIGLEVHIELLTTTKLFSRASAHYSGDANTQVDLFDIGFPGTYPVLNREAVIQGIKLAKALNCEIPDEVFFEKKNYFYPDLPGGYQLTQSIKPIGDRGYLSLIGLDKIIELDHIHMEVDASKLIHVGDFSTVDLNRGGLPLIEIVTKPCINSAEEAVTFLEELRSLVTFLKISEADSKKGQMRCDVNISISKDETLGTRVELKNINSFSGVADAINAEIKRQSEVLDQGGKLIQETRRLDEEDRLTYSMRSKENAVDYKYCVDTDILPFKIEDDFFKNIISNTPELPGDLYHKYKDEYEMDEKDVLALIKDQETVNYFEELIELGVRPVDGAKWLLSVIFSSMNRLECSLSELKITADILAYIIKLEQDGKVATLPLKEVIYEAIDKKVSPESLIKEKGLLDKVTGDELLDIVKSSIDKRPDLIEEFKEGKEYVANFFIGDIMRETEKKANPKEAKELIIEELKRR